MEQQQKKRILVVDDEKDTVAMISTLLELEGYQVFPTSSATQALEFLEREKEKLSDAETLRISSFSM